MLRHSSIHCMLAAQEDSDSLSSGIRWLQVGFVVAMRLDDIELSRKLGPLTMSRHFVARVDLLVDSWATVVASSVAITMRALIVVSVSWLIIIALIVSTVVVVTLTTASIVVVVLTMVSLLPTILVVVRRRPTPAVQLMQVVVSYCQVLSFLLEIMNSCGELDDLPSSLVLCL